MRATCSPIPDAAPVTTRRLALITEYVIHGAEANCAPNRRHFHSDPLAGAWLIRE